MLLDNFTLMALFVGILLLLAIPLGKFMAQLFAGEKTWCSPVIEPLERFAYRCSGVNPAEEMSWQTYAWALLLFNLIGFGFLFGLQLLQGMLPLNPQRLPGVRWDTALNTAISFVTNTNWQSYGGETTMSYLTQMLGLAVQNFLSAAVGITVQLALTRGFLRRNAQQIGNFWVDLTRATFYVLLPLALVFAVVLMSQGVVQTFEPYVTAKTLEGADQTIAVGPAASQIAIKQLGSNGGGFFNANSAHPFENPTRLTNFLETLAILLLPAALVFTFGYMLKQAKQGWAIFWVMLMLFLLGTAGVFWAETHGNPLLAKVGVAGGVNLEGKEVRFGVAGATLWGSATTAVSNGSVNSMHDSQLPLPGMVYLFNMGIGEVVFGGVGVGLTGMLCYILLAMFIFGLMIGRTPEFLGKKLGPAEMIWVMLALLLPITLQLILAALAVKTDAGLASLNNPGAHGLSEILYAYVSACANNGSAFAGLNANTVFYNLTLGLGILAGRIAAILPALAIAGALAAKKTAPASAMTFPTTGWLFIAITLAVVLIMGGLTFFPVFALGPILEHLLLYQ